MIFIYNISIDSLFTKMKSSLQLLLIVSTSLLSNGCEHHHANPCICSLDDTRPCCSIPKHPLKSSKSTPLKVSHSLWGRIHENFQILDPSVPDTSHPEVLRMAKIYSQPKKNLDKLSAQGAPFLYYVVEQLEAKGLPSELALIPFVESGFEPRATSNKGAAGIWQMLPGTGRQFGLKLDKGYDGRRDIVTSTQAALKYLTFLNDTFDNDWMLAIAAYNAGEGTILRAIKRNKQQGKPTNIWSLKLPKETREFVGKVMALAEIVSKQSTYGVTLSPIANKPYLTSVSVKPNTSLQEVALKADLKILDLKRLNPGFNNGKTHPLLSRLLLPVSNAEKLSLNLAQKEAIKPLTLTEITPTKTKSLSPSLFEDKDLGFIQHKIKSGENLMQLAKVYQTNIKTIKQINGLKSNAIKAGNTILVPARMAQANSRKRS